MYRVVGQVAPLQVRTPDKVPQATKPANFQQDDIDQVLRDIDIAFGS